MIQHRGFDFHIACQTFDDNTFNFFDVSWIDSNHSYFYRHAVPSLKVWDLYAFGVNYDVGTDIPAYRDNAFFNFGARIRAITSPTAEVSNDAGILATATARLPVTCHQAMK